MKTVNELEIYYYYLFISPNLHSLKIYYNFLLCNLTYIYTSILLYLLPTYNFIIFITMSVTNIITILLIDTILNHVIGSRPFKI